jgi:hypothetical protein
MQPVVASLTAAYKRNRNTKPLWRVEQHCLDVIASRNDVTYGNMQTNANFITVLLLSQRTFRSKRRIFTLSLLLMTS